MYFYKNSIRLNVTTLQSCLIFFLFFFDNLLPIQMTDGDMELR